MRIVVGDLMDASEKYIVQQCNCLTVKSHGLSATISKKYHWADPYSSRRRINRRNCAVPKDRDVPGTYKIMSGPNSGPNSKETPDPSVICIFGQWAPGTPLKYSSYPNDYHDSYENRVKWFAQALISLKSLGLESIAFPWKIGCGLAKGNWNIYYDMIQLFEKESGTKCVLYKLQ